MKGLKTRAITGVLFAAVVLGAIYGGEITSIILFGLVVLFASFELSRMTRKNIQDFWMILTLAAGVAPYILSLYYPLKGETLYIGIIIAASIFILFSTMMLLNKGAILFEKISPITAFLYLGIPFYLLRLVFLKPRFEWEILLSIILLIWSSDSFAYLIGSKIGKRKLYPRVSPGKSWEGFLGAGICSLLIAYVLFLLLGEFPLGFYLGLGLTVWLMGSSGDLFQSFLKRHFKVKDSGNFLPGHGGFLDRFDSFIFVIPFACLLMLLFKII